MNSVETHLISDFKLTVRDPLWGDISFTPEMLSIVRHPQMQKLTRIRQLGPVSLVYPGAVHTRFSHSLGVYHIGRQILISLLRNNDCRFTEQGVDSFLVAALLHDLGHFPFAHSLKDVVKRTHESLAVQIIREDKTLYDLIVASGADIDTVCSIVCPEETHGEQKANSDEVLFYQHLLSGALDPDKMDYLCRDAYFCGVPYGIQDVSWIIEHFTVCDGEPALDRENASSVEHLLFSKYLMYKNVYWHKTTRCATAMVKNAVVSALQENIIKENDLYFLDDNQFIELCSRKSYKPFEMVTRSNIRDLFYTNTEISCPNTFGEEEKEQLRQKALDMLKGKCEPNQIIVDLPEPISFESDIRLVNPDGSSSRFSECDELFMDTKISDTFTRALRKVRVFSPVDEVF